MSRGPRKPKNLDEYTDIETAAKGLEDFARDMRKDRDGMRVKWHVQVWFWHPDWEKKPQVAK